MICDTEAITTLIGIAYLFIGLAACISPVMFLLTAPKSVLAFAHHLDFWGAQILLLGPFFLIGYAWMRRRKWGWYLLIAFNGLWFAYLSYAFAARMINYSESHLVLVITGFLIILIVLGGSVVFAFHEDVRASMTR